MAVLNMQHISICGLKKNRSQVLELLQLEGVVEIRDIAAEDSIFQKIDVSEEKDVSEKYIIAAKQALEILSKHANEKRTLLGGTQGKMETPQKTYGDFRSRREAAVNVANKVNFLEKRIDENLAAIQKLCARIDKLSAWEGLDVPLDSKGTLRTAALIGTLPGNWDEQEIFEKMVDKAPICVEVISSSKEQTNVFIVCMKENQHEMSSGLKQLGFSSPGLSDSQNPAEVIKKLNEEIEQKSIDITKSQEQIIFYGKMSEEIQLLVDYETMLTEKKEALGRLLNTKNTFVLTGYIPEKYAPALSKLIMERFEVVLDLSEAVDDKDAPVLLENNKFSEPMEVVVEAFSPPGKGDIDPTMMTALFYYTFYGMMLSDAGYGIVMIAACGIILSRYKDSLGESAAKFLKIFLYCGFSSLFWGVMFGSYFGDLIGIVTRTFWGKEMVIPPLWLAPIDAPMRMIVLCMLLGIVQLYVGLGIKLYQSIKRRDYETAAYDVLLWYILLTSLIVILLSTQLVKNILGVDIEIRTDVMNISRVLAAASAAGIMLTAGREFENPALRIINGLYGLFGVTSYFSDVISYTRLLALGLATGVIGSVINLMAAITAGKSWLGVLPFTLIVILGHTLNLAINMLGAYVHTTRLQYVEYFGKFYSGGGRKFQAFGAKTKHYKYKGTENDE